jgi:hypothetical protein
MKKFSSLSKLTAVLGLGFILFCSCGNSNVTTGGEANDTTINVGSDGELLEAIKAMDESCPMSLGDVGEINSIKYIDGCVSFKYVFNENYVDIDAFNENQQLIKHNVKQSFSYMDNEDLYKLFQLMQEEGCDFEINYVGKDSKKTAQVKLSADDIADILNADKEYNPKKILENEINIFNAQCPMAVENGISATHATYDDNEFVYYYKADEDIISIEALQEKSLEVKREIINTLTSNSGAEMLIKSLKDADATLIYKYIGDTTGETCTIRIYNSEL